MAPAADGTPSPWANDDEVKALLAEAALLIEGEPGRGGAAGPLKAPGGDGEGGGVRPAVLRR